MQRRTFSIAALATVTACAILWNSGQALASDLVEITTCGQIVQHGGYLSADLDCSAQTENQPTVAMESPRATLELRGFTLKGRSSTDQNTSTVRCNRRCFIEGPGTIVGRSTQVTEYDDRNVVVGLEWNRSNHWNASRIEVNGATITGGGIGVAARAVTLFDAVVSNNRSVGVWTFFARVENSEVSGNGLGGQGIVRAGVFGQVRSKIVNSTVSGNGMMGVEGWRIALENSTVTGNSEYETCATNLCVDLAARFPPRVQGVTCGTSLDENIDHWGMALPDRPIANWGICDLD